MRLLTLVAIAVFSAGCTSSHPESCSPDTGKSVTVHGHGTLRLKPDGVSFAAGVESRAASITDAFRSNTRDFSAVLAALKQEGVTAEEMQTSAVDVSPIVSNRGKVTGFRVSNRVTVRRLDTDSAPALLQAAVAAGANQVGSVRFFVSDPAASQRTGLELAFQDARAKAEALAALSGRILGAVVCVSDESEGSRDDTYDRLASLGYMSAPSLEAGTQELSTRVTVVFELK